MTTMGTTAKTVRMVKMVKDGEDSGRDGEDGDRDGGEGGEDGRSCLYHWHKLPPKEKEKAIFSVDRLFVMESRLSAALPWFIRVQK